jgi:hypothetical protein
LPRAIPSSSHASFLSFSLAQNLPGTPKPNCVTLDPAYPIAQKEELSQVGSVLKSANGSATAGGAVVNPVSLSAGVPFRWRQRASFLSTFATGAARPERVRRPLGPCFNPIHSRVWRGPRSRSAFPATVHWARRSCGAAPQPSHLPHRAPVIVPRSATTKRTCLFLLLLLLAVRLSGYSGDRSGKFSRTRKKDRVV